LASESVSESGSALSIEDYTCADKLCIDRVFSRRYRLDWGYGTPGFDLLCGQNYNAPIVLTFIQQTTATSPSRHICSFNSGRPLRYDQPGLGCVDGSLLAGLGFFPTVGMSIATDKPGGGSAGGFVSLTAQVHLIAANLTQILASVTYQTPSRSSLAPKINCLGPITLDFVSTTSDTNATYSFHRALTNNSVSTANPWPGPQTVTLTPV
jgi:hypothetical protein